VDAVFPGIEDVGVSMLHATRERALGPGEAYVLSMITAWVQPRRIFEIGTASGQGTLLMARQAPEACIDTMDLGNERPSLGKAQRGQPPWQGLTTVGSAFRDTEHASRITQHFADSAQFDYRPFNRRIDLTFIDGAHTYPYVMSDSRHALEMRSPRGVIVWDDCTAASPGVSRALLRLRREGEPIFHISGTRLAVRALQD
jgi:Methyltransferase domain